MNKIAKETILLEIKKYRRGILFFTENFISKSNAKTVNKTLERLAASGEIARVALGIYTRPKKSRLFGFVLPGAEEVVRAIAKRDKARIVPTGYLALNKLGLSTQIPMNLVYLTDGAARKIVLGKQTIVLKKVTPKNLSAKGSISSLVIQALKAIGKNKIRPEEENKIIALLQQEKQDVLEHDMALAPEWARKIMRKALVK
jgi:hypothetical protein